MADPSDDAPVEKKSAKPAAKKSGATRARKDASSRSSRDAGDRSSSAPRAQRRPKTRSVDVARRASQEFFELTGKAQEGVVGLERTDDGWTVQLEVVEVRRIPDTTDMLGVYDIETDEQGSVEGYRRVRRYVRGSGEEGS